MLFEVLVTSTVDGIEFRAGRIYTLPALLARELVAEGLAKPVKRYDKMVTVSREVKDHAED